MDRKYGKRLRVRFVVTSLVYLFNVSLRGSFFNNECYYNFVYLYPVTMSYNNEDISPLNLFANNGNWGNFNDSQINQTAPAISSR